MVTLALALLLSQTPQHRLFLQPNLPQGASYAFFEAFPANGAGTSGACSTTPPTGAKGEALTFTRASNGTCTKTATGGLATSGIANGDLVVLSSNQPRVEYDSAGTLGLLVEASRTNVNLQSANLANGIYSNVGTPTVTANTTVSPDGTTTMATIQDTSGAALEGRSQTVTVTAGQPYTLSVFVKAGTLSAVTVSLDGTTATCTSLSATTSTRCIVTDASASGAAIVASVTAGTVVSDTGSFKAWGQQVEQGNYASSYIPTGAGTATRGAESAYLTFASSSVGSMAISFVTNRAMEFPVRLGEAYADANNFWLPYVGVSPWATVSQTIAGASKTFTTTQQFTSSGQQRFAQWAIASATLAGVVNSVEQTNSSGVLGQLSGATSFYVGTSHLGDGHMNGVVSRICLDPEPTRCR